ncbi:hypothetical protein MPH_11744 [Macrophomina phaseolina MS6]|uniref:Uncharacterized protein n=1 Tax=Macrophomina phaseolina (strain MS6) TaxID=1126212 RepID=K2QMN3_MACPH|nr:hypothetical protein MPH_11744 [Macrophomina phaseolina MS6]
MSSLSPSLQYPAPKPSMLYTFSNDHALFPELDSSSEAAPSSDFQLYPDGTISTSPYTTTSSKALLSIREKPPQDMTNGHEYARDERVPNMLQTCPTLDHEHYSALRTPLQYVQSLRTVRTGSTYTAGYPGHLQRSVELPGEKICSEMSNALGAECPGPSPYRSWTEIATKPSNNGSDAGRVPSPPPAPRIERLRTPDLVPMEACTFCECCTTSDGRRPRELCRKRELERDFDLFGVGMMFD